MKTQEIWIWLYEKSVAYKIATCCTNDRLSVHGL